MFKVLIRSSNEGKWSVYGEFASEAEWERELPHIRFLSSMGPVYLKRVRV